jgi:hypothetical protein
MEKLQMTSSETLDGMSHAALAELLAEAGVSKDEIVALKSKEERRAKVRELMGVGEEPKQEGEGDDPAPLPQGDPGDETQSDGDDPVTHIDTRADDPETDAPVARKRISDVVTEAARAATKASDHARHAELHKLETAIGEFKRACAAGVDQFDEGSDVRGALNAIASEL